MFEYLLDPSFAKSIGDRAAGSRRAPKTARTSRSRNWVRACLLLLIAMPAVSPCRADDDPPPAKNARDGEPADAQRFWVQTEYLLRWMRGNSLPPLVTLPPGVGGGPAKPQPRMNASGLWSQGLNAGLEFRF